MRIVRRITTSSRNRDWSAFTENVSHVNHHFFAYRTMIREEVGGVFATHEIERGTNAFSQDAFCDSSEVKGGKERFCRGCLKCLGKEFVTVNNGSEDVRYCSESCRDESMRRYDELFLRLDTSRLYDVYEKEGRKFPTMVTQLLCSVLQELRLGELLSPENGFVERIWGICVI